MYNHITLFFKYVTFYIKAKKLHGVHSPFVYRFSEAVLYKKPNKTLFIDIEYRRKALLQSKDEIIVEDLGAGSRISKTNKRFVKDIAKNALKSPKWALLIHNTIAYFNCNHCIELGTCLGITTAYISRVPNIKGITTIEGSKYIYDIAVREGNTLGLQQVQYIHDNFDHALPKILNSITHVDCIYVDGNHKYEPTINYFKQALAKTNEHTIMIFDDIHWSSEMEKAWDEIKNHDKVMVSIDLFFIGIIFFRTAQKEKEHFCLRY